MSKELDSELLAIGLILIFSVFWKYQNNAILLRKNIVKESFKLCKYYNKVINR